MCRRPTAFLITLSLLAACALNGACTRALGSFEQGVCGNDVYEPELGEECDDGNVLPGDGCSQDCVVEITAGCGNGVLEAVEDCDDGNRAAGDGCDPDCRLE